MRAGTELPRLTGNLWVHRMVGRYDPSVKAQRTPTYTALMSKGCNWFADSKIPQLFSTVPRTLVPEYTEEAVAELQDGGSFYWFDLIEDTETASKLAQALGIDIEATMTDGEEGPEPDLEKVIDLLVEWQLGQLQSLVEDDERISNRSSRQGSEQGDSVSGVERSTKSLVQVAPSHPKGIPGFEAPVGLFRTHFAFHKVGEEPVELAPSVRRSMAPGTQKTFFQVVRKGSNSFNALSEALHIDRNADFLMVESAVGGALPQADGEHESPMVYLIDLIDGGGVTEAPWQPVALREQAATLEEAIDAAKEGHEYISGQRS